MSFQEEHVDSRKQYLHQGDGKIQKIPYMSKNGSETKWVVSIRAKKC